ncbi:MAG: hypothetical protein R3Y59_06850 [bacterium]
MKRFNFAGSVSNAIGTLNKNISSTGATGEKEKTETEKLKEILLTSKINKTQAETKSIKSHASIERKKMKLEQSSHESKVQARYAYSQQIMAKSQKNNNVAIDSHNEYQQNKNVNLLGGSNNVNNV